MTQTLPLSENVTVKLNAFGDGTAKIGPRAHGVTWQAQTASVKVAGQPTNEASCSIYVGGSATDENFVGATFTGSSGDTTGAVAAMGSQMQLGTYIWAVWHNGDPGATATLTVSGQLLLEG
jgi:hypothetical protein